MITGEAFGGASRATRGPLRFGVLNPAVVVRRQWATGIIWSQRRQLRGERPCDVVIFTFGFQKGADLVDNVQSWRNFKKNIHKLRVKLRSATSSDFIDGGLPVESGAVNARCGHGVQGVCNGDNTGLKGDLFSLQAIGIPLAIKAFVVSHNDGCDIVQFFNRGKYFNRFFWMAFNDRVLFSGEFAWFKKNVIADPDFSNIVQQAGYIEPFQLSG